MPRIEWSGDGTALLTVIAGTLRRHGEGGASTIVDGPSVLDACWHDDGSIVAIDDQEHTRRHAGAGGELFENRSRRPLVSALITPECYVAISREDLFAGSVALNPEDLFVADLTGRKEWHLDPSKHSLAQWHVDDRRLTALSSDGKLVAVAYQTRGDAHVAWARAEGRGWVVFDTSKDEVVDRSWNATKREASMTQIAFDAAGKRIALATTAPGPCIGAIRLDRDEKYPRTHLGGATAVAIDRRGLLAAYAYPAKIEAAPRRLRVDYLERGAKGGSAITIADTLWIDPDLQDLVAIAFDRASRRIACVDAHANVDVVPVP